MPNLYLPGAASVLSLLVVIIFFSKKSIDLFENKIYKVMMFSVLIENILMTLIFCCVYMFYSESLVVILNKIDYCFLVIWSSCLLLYTLVTINKDHTGKNIKKWLTMISAIDVITFILIFILNVDVVLLDAIRQTTFGSSVMCAFVVCGLYIFTTFIYVICNFKNVTKKQIPIFTIVGLCLLIVGIYSFNRYFVCISIGLAFVNLIMYFTIENPDIKMITALNEAKEAADKANNAKSDFLSSMSHEIRTPLNAIVGFSHGLLESDLNDSAKEDVKNIIMASDSLLELVNGILDISKIEANKLEIIDTTYNFSKMFDELVLLTKARMGEKPLDFRYSYDESIPKYLYGDGSRVKQVILNLLTNSVKYTKEGYVDFKINSVIKDDVIRLIISVEDSGIGIKKESIDKLFTKFERLGVEKNTTTEGTGLGLAITKKLVEMMGGNVVVHSVFGKGSKFTVSIDQRFASEEEIKRLEVESKPVTNEEKIDASDKKVLVVDDNKLNLKVAERLLKPFNINVETIDNGTDCINKITSGNHYDLILLDDMMPKMSGTETMKKLREINGFNIPVVVLTANAIAGMKEKYISEGFDDYLSKPIEKTELNRVIKKYLN